MERNMKGNMKKIKKPDHIEDLEKQLSSNNEIKNLIIDFLLEDKITVEQIKEKIKEKKENGFKKITELLLVEIGDYFQNKSSDDIAYSLFKISAEKKYLLGSIRCGFLLYKKLRLCKSENVSVDLSDLSELFNEVSSACSSGNINMIFEIDEDMKNFFQETARKNIEFLKPIWKQVDVVYNEVCGLEKFEEIVKKIYGFIDENNGNSILKSNYFLSLYDKLFMFDDSNGDWNQLVSTLCVSNSPESKELLIGLLKFSAMKNDISSIETLLEYGLDVSIFENPGLSNFKKYFHSLKQVQQYCQIPNHGLDNMEDIFEKNIEELEQLKSSFNGKILSKQTLSSLENINRVIYSKNIFDKKKLNNDYPVRIERKTLNGEILDKSDCSFYLLFKDNESFVLPNGNNAITIINKLITTLLYESQRHERNNSSNEFQSIQCSRIFAIIKKIDADFSDFSRSDFLKIIERREKRGHTFFSEDLSDDSDNAMGASCKEEMEQDETSEIGISFIEKFVKEINHDQAKKLFSTREQFLPERKSLENKGEYLDFNHRVVTKHFFNKREKKLEELTPIQKDLLILNQHIRNGKTISDAVAKVKTKFFVAQYRGITYLTSTWNASSRRAHRKMMEEGVPQYSNSVYQLTQFDMFRKFSEEKYKENQPLFQTVAERLQDMLLEMRHISETPETNYEFDNLAEFVQDFYSKQYEEFHEALKAGVLHQYIGKYFINDANPFVSTGDRPYHALRYAYGIKPYKGRENERLRPRWNKDGQAERPYSGKVYISLHKLTDYDENGPMHLVSLVDAAKSNLKNIIVPERETSFPAYMAKGKVIHTHLAKYPSFSRDYDPKYLYKYGFSKNLYDIFRESLKKYPPHSYENRYLKKILGDWLCSYQERKLFNLAANQATNKEGGVLVYKDTEGLYSFSLPKFGVFGGDDNREKYNAIMAGRENRKK